MELVSFFDDVQVVEVYRNLKKRSVVKKLII